MVVLALALGALLCPTAFSQSATDFNPRKITPKASAQQTSTVEKDLTPVPAETDKTTPIDAGPSRYVDETNVDSYVKSLSSAFSMKTRETDPFGQYQDPDAKPIVKPTLVKSKRRFAPTQVTSFAEIIKRIQVTTIMPGERRFLVGTRSFKQGDRFPINFRGRATNVEIAAVSSRAIEFRNVETNDTASLKLDLLPVGMTPGNGKITPPGMIPDQPNSPLDLEQGN